MNGEQMQPTPPTAPSELVPTSHAAIAAGIERFAAAHRDELTPAQVLTLGEAAGILHRTHPAAG
jgi:hypothetical protein